SHENASTQAAGVRSAAGKQEIIAEIKKLAKKLKRTPSRTELLRSSSVTRHELNRTFLNYREALAASGLRGRAFRISVDELFADWAGVARKLGKIPTINEYDMHARHSHVPLIRHFGGWLHVPGGLLQHAREHKLEQGWEDVMELLAWNAEPAPKFRNALVRTAAAEAKPWVTPGEPIYGPPLFDAPLAMAPMSENAVIFLFGAVARDLGFLMVRLQTGFPDGEGFREVEPGRWQFKKIEFELESRNYVKHGHAAGGAHILVCWKHNWPECPLEVIELRKLVGALQEREHGGWTKSGDLVIGRSGDRKSKTRRIADSAVIADIARHRRKEKG
ncbi:MAG TPA: hypothetical protein VFR84_15535, partial [Candidatus Angelobacter sp.]|nr:hypothetical protein [Candidatus Angelobacter sp.]